MSNIKSIKNLFILGVSVLCATTLMSFRSNYAYASHRIYYYHYNRRVHRRHTYYKPILINQNTSHQYSKYEHHIRYYYKPRVKRRFHTIKQHGNYKKLVNNRYQKRISNMKGLKPYKYHKNKRVRKYSVKKHNTHRIHKSYMPKRHFKKYYKRTFIDRKFRWHHAKTNKLKLYKYVTKHKNIKKTCQKYIKRHTTHRKLKPIKFLQQVVRKPMLRKKIKSTKKQDYTINDTYQSVLKIAKSKLGDAYAWGGNGPDAFDCSGFTKYIYQYGAHKTLYRLAGDQYYHNPHISFTHRRPGDLVFFGPNINNITHVGMYIGNDMMIDDQLRGVVIEKISVPWWHAVGYSRPLA